MNLRFIFGSSVAALVLFSGAMADPLPGQPNPDDKTAHQDRSNAITADTIIQVAAVTREIAQFAATTAVVASPIGEPGALAETPEPATNSTAKSAGRKHTDKDKSAIGSDNRAMVGARRRRLAAAEAKPMSVRPVGRSETGTAAWYGGRYVGRRTTSGDRLDTVHPTAAHRTLPLNSLARVTNLENGRSVIVRVTDRGPVSESLLIDMSPRAADQLEMKEAGLVPVKVEQVVAVSPDQK
jgi:rare lipoprotein A